MVDNEGRVGDCKLPKTIQSQISNDSLYKIRRKIFLLLFSLKLVDAHMFNSASLRLNWFD
jgi:hypothetical protein